MCKEPGAPFQRISGGGVNQAADSTRQGIGCPPVQLAIFRALGHGIILCPKSYKGLPRRAKPQGPIGFAGSRLALGPVPQKSGKEPSRASALVFRSHGIHPTQINRHLPEALRLPAIQWSTPDHLKAVLGQPHIDCINAYFALDPLWLEGEAASPHQLIPSYKDPRALYDWLKARNPHDAPGIFKVHFISSDGAEISSGTHGDFAMVLEHFAEHASAPSLFFYLTEGAHFSHQPCILHLMQTLAILHVNGASMQRSTLPPKALAQLSENIGSIPAVLTKSRPHRLAADHELWDHYSGSSPWLASLRSEMESTLIAAGLPDVVAKVRADALKWARK
jgi:hypothetical protein